MHNHILDLNSWLVTACILLFSIQVLATHNRAGEITYIQLDELRVQATITTWTKTSSNDVDRDSLQIFWGDGNVEWLRRVNGPDGNGEELENDIKKNEYTGTHNYPGRGTYVLSMIDPNRIGGILNVSFPNSLNVPFYIQTTLTLVNPVFQGFNNSPLLLQPPIDFGCVGEVFLHNPNALDPDGDSLSYELIVPFQDSSLIVDGYQYPDRIEAGPENVLDFDEVTGTFTWTSPQRTGEYNIAIAVKEWRNGVLINTTIRDMQIFIRACENKPPELIIPDDICVVAGETIEFNVIASDPDLDQQIRLTALGGPFIQNNSPATFDAPLGYVNSPLNSTFKWETNCEHINDQYYTVIFRVVDDFLGSSGLATLAVLRIKIVGPAPENLSADRENNGIAVSWENPYTCQDLADNYFQGFTLYRKINSSQLEIDTCNPGLKQSVYEPIAFNITDIMDNRYTYLDQDIEKGFTYCYRVVAEFGRVSDAGVAFNLVEGLPSDEVCQMLSRDIPLISHVDVRSTDDSNGEIFIQWLKPDVVDLDTIENKGPYQFRLMRASDINGTQFTEITDARIQFNSFNNNVDSFYLDNNIDTRNSAYTYRVDFYVNNEFSVAFNSSPTASSIFLNAQSNDRAINLNWDEAVSWDNYTYTIYRSIPNGSFDSIGATAEQSFTDSDLINGEEYCYKIEAFGSYGISGLPEPLINYSQEVCGIPLDTMPPCPLIIEVNNICDDNPTDIAPNQLINNLSWNNPNINCENTSDAIGYRIYYSPTQGQSFSLLTEIGEINTLSYEHLQENGIAGCYAVTSYDRLDNEAEFSNIVCVDNCPEFILPNTFTPNGDGANEYFGPIRSRFIESLDIIIFNRWGGVVYKSNDPDFKWTGVDLNGKNVDDGTYYYTCRVFEQRVDGIIEQEEVLQGFIHLLR